MTAVRYSPLVPGWRHAQQDRPDLTGVPMRELLRRCASLPGTFRLGSLDGRGIVQIGDERDPADPSPSSAIETGVVEDRLESVGMAWKRREDGWAVPAAAHTPREITLAVREGVLEASADLFAMEEIPDGCVSALSRYLCRAQLGLRFARIEWDEGQGVRLAGRLAARDVVGGLPHVLGGISAGIGHLARDGAALLTEEVAERFSKFFDREPVTSGGLERI